MHLDRLRSDCARVSSQQALIERAVRFHGPLKRISLRPLACSALESCAFPIVGTKAGERPVQCAIVGRINEQGSSVPKLSERGYVREDKGTSSGSGFQYGK